MRFRLLHVITMAKKKNPEQQLYDGLMAMPSNVWYSVKKSADKPEDTEWRLRRIKLFIDTGAQLELSVDHSRVKRLTDVQPLLDINWSVIDGYRAEEKACPADKWGKQSKYREIFINDKLVAVESL